MKELWLKYKEWWANLASREKKAVIGGGSVLVFFIVYQWAWTPYLETVSSLRKQIKVDNSLLQWMQTTDKTIRQLEGESGEAKLKSSPVIVLGMLKKQIERAGFYESLTQLKQIANDSIEMHFQKVEFDKWIKLIISVVNEQKVTIVQMSVTADNTTGLVNADLILRV